jgi:hypothetical protein
MNKVTSKKKITLFSLVFMHFGNLARAVGREEALKGTDLEEYKRGAYRRRLQTKRLAEFVTLLTVADDLTSAQRKQVVAQAKKLLKSPEIGNAPTVTLFCNNLIAAHSA